MSTKQSRPEPGIATDDELETAADELWNAVEDTDMVFSVQCDRLDGVVGRCDDSTEVIRVYLENGGRYQKTEVINAALGSDAPVTLRDIHPDSDDLLTFYPTNQDE